MRQCRLLTPFQESPHQNCSFKEKTFFPPNSASKLANWIIVDILKYLYVITGKLLAEGPSIFVDPNESDQ